MFSSSYLVVGGIATGIILLGYAIYAYYLHPAWRTERRLIQACDKAFGEGGYKLERLEYPTQRKYFRYNITPQEEGSFNRLSKRESALLRKHLEGTPPPYLSKTTIREPDD